MSLVLALFAAAPQAAIDPPTRTAIEATCFDYLDGQLEGDPARVARALHPDLAKRRVLGDTPDERLGLRRMSKEELVDLTRQGALKTPREQWNRSCRVLDVAGNAAVARDIVSRLEAHGLRTEWDGSWDQRIGVALDWKRRR